MGIWLVAAEHWGLLDDQQFQPGDPLMEISDGIGGSLKPGEPAFQRESVLGELLPLLLEASLLPRVGWSFPVGTQDSAAKCRQEAPPCSMVCPWG